ncbi:hypothetical protein ACLOJK_018937 [Asimina triloba]
MSWLPALKLKPITGECLQIWQQPVKIVAKVILQLAVLTASSVLLDFGSSEIPDPANPPSGKLRSTDQSHSKDWPRRRYYRSIMTRDERRLPQIRQQGNNKI